MQEQGVITTSSNPEFFGQDLKNSSSAEDLFNTRALL